MKKPHNLNALSDDEIERFVEGAQANQGDDVDRLFEEIDQILAKTNKEPNGE